MANAVERSGLPAGGRAPVAVRHRVRLIRVKAASNYLSWFVSIESTQI